MSSLVSRVKRATDIFRRDVSPSEREGDVQHAGTSSAGDSFASKSLGQDDSQSARVEGSSPSATTATVKAPDAWYGIRTVYEPPDPTDAVVDIVFVHGLTGNAYTTWLDRRSNIHWPSTLLGQDISSARIMTFGYDADIVNWFKKASQNNVYNHAETLLGDLVRRRERTDSEHRKIIFVAHSLGGLVVQAALSLSGKNPDFHLRQFESHTVGIA